MSEQEHTAPPAQNAPAAAGEGAPMGNAETDQMAFLVAQMLQQMQGKFEQMSGAILGRSLCPALHTHILTCA